MGLNCYVEPVLFYGSECWTIDDCAKDGGKEFFLPRCIAFYLRILNDSIGIQLKNEVHLGKKFLAAIFGTIACFGTNGEQITGNVIVVSQRTDENIMGRSRNERVGLTKS